MLTQVITTPVRNLSRSGIKNTESIHYQLSPEELVQDTLRLGEGVLNDTAALIVRTGEFTGRSPKDKFIVKDQITAESIHWNDFNLPIEQKYFDIIHAKILEYFENLPELWVRDCYACADPRYRLKIRVINETPWNNLFAYNMFLRPTWFKTRSICVRYKATQCSSSFF
jgi:phosphoenolpyruvate carboxykinase (ATP)